MRRVRARERGRETERRERERGARRGCFNEHQSTSDKKRDCIYTSEHKLQSFELASHIYKCVLL